jgi:para-aminobenzoate synthetase component 1
MELSPKRMKAWAQDLNQAGAAGKRLFFLVDFEQEAPHTWLIDEGQLDIPKFVFPNHRNIHVGTPSPQPELVAEHISKDQFREAFEVVKKGLHRGDSFLTNLTFPTPIKLHGTMEAVFHHSEALYRIWWPNKFVCFSPETFVTISADGYIESRPMKGTSLDTPSARRALQRSPKEVAEHATIVDLIRNDLSQVAKKVRVTRYRYFHKIATSRRGLLQTSSNIGGELGPQWPAQLGDIMLKLLPAGSVSGAPKPATLDIIREAEGGPRGYYCGIAGYFDGVRLDTCVLIRFIEEDESGRHYFRSGGGITAQSDWREEYLELKAKIRIPLAVSHFSLH